MSRQIGKSYELLAKDFLKKKGLKILAENFYAYRGEIDLICQDRDSIIFVEVRYRHTASHGSSTETVAYAKQQSIIKTAQHFLQRKGWTDRYACRFDVIGISGDETAPIEWIQNAFDAS